MNKTEARCADAFTPWPPEFEARYKAEGYWGDVLLGDIARGDPSRTAVVAGRDRVSYGELDRRVANTASGLLRLGVERGDRVIVQLLNTTGFVVTFLALARIGAIPVLALPAHRESEIRYLCELADARAYVCADTDGGFDYRAMARALPVEHVIVDGDAQELVALAELAGGTGGPAEIWNRPAPSDIGVLLLSGGTTGLPKLIPRTHRDYVYNLEASAEVCGVTAGTVYLAVLPVAHNFALACPGVLGVLAAGGTVVLASSGSPDEAFPLIERERVTACALVPPLAHLWLEAAPRTRNDLSSLALLQVGGARFAPERAARVPEVLGCALQQVFGMAEGLLNYTRLDDPPELVERTQGRPLSPADEIRIVDAKGAPVAPGEVGELLTRGPYTPRGYYRAPEHNRLAFTADGFYRTGDLVRRLPSGHLVVEGREKDQINRGGDKISAAELESHLLAHPAVHDAAVVAIPDPVVGERTCAYLIARRPHAKDRPAADEPAEPAPERPTLRQIRDFLRERGVAAYKFPDRIEYVASFPRTAVGKISKKDLVAAATR
ncbi:(2,3-dihydroxybenzoyl)adenylate synthase [Actinomadura fibrosa]|uniref:(2,3-dihydroxybenzoyl)adenylate synthase n=1 Tax=Actinomadura fibrosa TaxID=111802 RepID=A0ABW2XD66_9ACTN|nr:AMP-binding protein [Actinomadura fibrosa]